MILCTETIHVYTLFNERLMCVPYETKISSHFFTFMVFQIPKYFTTFFVITTTMLDFHQVLLSFVKYMSTV